MESFSPDLIIIVTALTVPTTVLGSENSSFSENIRVFLMGGGWGIRTQILTLDMSRVQGVEVKSELTY